MIIDNKIWHFPEDDFDISEKAAVFNPGEIETTIFISITNDSILEQDELFDIVLTNSTDTGVQVGMPRVTGVSIMNTDSKFCIYCLAIDNTSVSLL